MPPNFKGKGHEACQLDKHGLVCKSQEIAEEALSVAYRAGQLDERCKLIEILKGRGWGILEINELVEELYDDER